MSAALAAPLHYTKLAGLLHWLSVPSMTGSVACVLYAQTLPKGAEKGEWMYRHKSLGLLTGMVMVPRVATKVMSRSPSALPGSSFIESSLAKLSHYGLYLFGIGMPATGIVMGLNGAGLPFFTTTIKVDAVKVREGWWCGGRGEGGWR